MLDILLNMYTEYGKSQIALDILSSDYNIPLRSVNKEVDTMCNLSQGIYDDGVAKGIEQGVAEGMAKGVAEGMAKGVAEGEITKAVKVVENLLAKGFSLEEALSIADIDKETYENHCGE